MDYKLERNSQGAFYVAELEYDGMPTSLRCKNVLLLVRYKAGDCDTVTEDGRAMHEALYDLYQCNEHLKDGDTFSLNGKIVYRCKGVHVHLVDDLDS